MLGLVKSILFPGAASSGSATHIAIEGGSMLRTGLIVAGGAGILRGVAILQTRGRAMLWLGFWLLLLMGVVFLSFTLSPSLFAMVSSYQRE